MAERDDHFAGLLLGTAVGDALGLPREGMSRRRARRIFGDGPLQHRFFLARGMVSDDTEHACMTAQALLARPDDERLFARSLAWRLRLWLLGIPAGVGFGTLRAIVKLWLGFPPHLSGVRSAGNGPAMRAPVVGAARGRASPGREAFVDACTRLTHRDPRAEEGARAIALCAAHAMEAAGGRVDADAVLADLRAHASLDEFRTLLDGIAAARAADAATSAYADGLGLVGGVGGYIFHTVPVCIYAWLRNPGDFRRAVEDVVALGGDADTAGAIVGALAGATAGASGIPREWLDGIVEWPRSVTWMRRVAGRLARRFPAEGTGAPAPPARLFWPAIPLRNLAFLLIVLLHGLRRLLPPW